MVHKVNRRTIQAGLSGLLVAAVAVLAIGVWVSSSDANNPTPFADAAAAYSNGSSEAAAMVNGQVIPMSLLESTSLLRGAFLPGADAYAIPSESELLRVAIENETLYQEAERLGLVPSDAEVMEAAVERKAGILEGMKLNDEGGSAMREIMSQLVGTPYHVDVYDSSPEMLDATRRQLAINAVREIALEGVSDEVRNDIPARERLIAAYAASLNADVRIFADVSAQ
jgi:hypothetical protein